MNLLSAIGDAWPCIAVPILLIVVLVFWRQRDEVGTMAPSWGAAGVFLIVLGVVAMILVVKAVLESPESWGINPVSPDDILYPFIQGGK